VINAEMTQNWEGDTFTAFINPVINGITKVGKQIVQLQIGHVSRLQQQKAVKQISE
jgi:hypothetical protein